MPMAKIRRLGTSSDSKNYIYNHQAPNSASTLQPPPLNPTPSQPSSYSLINATKLPYNPINHSTTYSQPKVPLPHYHSGIIRINWDRCPRRRIWGDWMHLIIPRSLRRSWLIMQLIFIGRKVPVLSSVIYRRVMGLRNFLGSISENEGEGTPLGGRAYMLF